MGVLASFFAMTFKTRARPNKNYDFETLAGVVDYSLICY
jgi:hypothetical protein